MGAQLRKQIVTSVKQAQERTCQLRQRLRPSSKKGALSYKPIRLGIGDKGYDDEKNYGLLWEELHAMSIIPARNKDVPVWRAKGKYRKEMKRGYSK